jgi:hypothetical protein
MHFLALKDPMKKIYETLDLYTGLTQKEIEQDLNEKVEILKWLHKKDINDVHKIGKIMAHYYHKKSIFGKKDDKIKKDNAAKQKLPVKDEPIPVPNTLRDFSAQNKVQTHVKSPFEIANNPQESLDLLGSNDVNPFMQRPQKVMSTKEDRKTYGAAFETSLLDKKEPDVEKKDISKNDEKANPPR